MLTSLSKRFHYTPPAQLSPYEQGSPKLILLFGWMGAPLNHVQKYVSGYHKIWPSSPIILVQSLPADWRPLSKFGREYGVLETLLKQHDVDITNPKSDVLMAVMSNGGCWSATALMNQLSSSSILRPRALIYDSCPGVGRFSVTLRAFLIAGKYRLLRKAIAIVVITLWYFASKLVNTIAGINPVKQLRDNMIHRIQTQKRVYIYSDCDDIILSKDVEEHARQSSVEKPDEPVELQKFNKSGHVNHLREDEARYWGIVRDAWKKQESIKSPPEVTEVPVEETMPPMSLARATSTSSNSSTTPVPSTRPLFGGAISTSTPSTYTDASQIRQIPDNQEVLLDPSSDCSLIIELVERIDASDEAAINEHFSSLCQDNDATSSQILSTHIIPHALGPARSLVGLQDAPKFNDEARQVISVVGMLRLEQVKADVLVSMYIPQQEQIQEHRRSRNLQVRKELDFAKTTVDKAIADFQVLDWSLFP